MSDLDTGWVPGFVEPLRVRPGSKVVLQEDFDPGERFGVAKKDGAELLQQSVQLLADYQERLAAQGTYAVLVVLQGIDVAGKDSTIRHVMSGVNPQGHCPLLPRLLCPRVRFLALRYGRVTISAGAPART